MAIHYIYTDLKKDFSKKSYSPKTVYKYLSLRRAFECLDNNAFWFSNPMQWRDPYEKLFLKAKYFLRGVSRPAGYPYDKIYCFCLRENPNCEAAWKMYGDDVVRFKIDWKGFVKMLEENTKDYDVYVGKIHYLKRKAIRDLTLMGIKKLFLCDGNAADPYVASMFIKRESFSYESEIRVLIRDRSDYAKWEKGKSLSLPNIRELVRGVLLSPECKRADGIKRLFVSRYQFSLKGSPRVQKSSLYGNPKVLEVHEQNPAGNHMEEGVGRSVCDNDRSCLKEKA